MLRILNQLLNAFSFPLLAPVLCSFSTTCTSPLFSKPLDQGPTLTQTFSKKTTKNNKILNLLRVAISYRMILFIG